MATKFYRDEDGIVYQHHRKVPMRPRVMVRRLTPGGRKRFYFFDLSELTTIPAHEAIP